MGVFFKTDDCGLVVVPGGRPAALASVVTPKYDPLMSSDLSSNSRRALRSNEAMELTNLLCSLIANCWSSQIQLLRLLLSFVRSDTLMRSGILLEKRPCGESLNDTARSSRSNSHTRVAKVILCLKLPTVTYSSLTALLYVTPPRVNLRKYSESSNTVT